MLVLAKPEIKMLLLLILMFELNLKIRRKFVIIFLQKLGTFFGDLVLGLRHG